MDILLAILSFFVTICKIWFAMICWLILLVIGLFLVAVIVTMLFAIHDYFKDKNNDNIRPDD